MGWRIACAGALAGLGVAAAPPVGAFCLYNDVNLPIELRVELATGAEDEPLYRNDFWPEERRCCGVGSLVCALGVPANAQLVYYAWIDRFGPSTACRTVARADAALHLSRVFLASRAAHMECTWDR